MKNKTGKGKKVFKKVFGSLFKNSVVVENSKGPFWQALICGVVGVWLPVVPIVTTISKTTGSDFLSESLYDFDHQLVEVLEDLKSNNFKVSINENHELLVYQSDNPVSVSGENQSALISSYQVNGEYGLNAYYTTLPFTAEDDENAKSVTTFISTLGTTYYTNGSLVPSSSEAESGTYYVPSVLVFHNTGIYCAIAQTGSSTIYGYTNYAPDLLNVSAADDLISTFLEVRDEEGTLITENKYNVEYCNGVLSNFKTFLNSTYSVAKKNYVKVSTLVYAGVYGGLVLLMSTLLFILTRGKRNMYNYLTYNDVAKMAGWAALCPGILSLLLGFIVSKYATMLFILTFGMRVMWLSMKQLRPQA